MNAASTPLPSAPLIVGIGGTTRPNSSSETAVRAVLAAATRKGAHTRMFGGEALAALPHFAPEKSERTPEQRAFIDAVRQADGLVIGTPGYHGGVSGLVKNALDLLEDLRADTRVYFDGRAVGCIVTAAGWQACGVTLQAMRGIVHAMRGWPTPLGVILNTSASPPFDRQGACLDEAVAEQFDIMADQVMRFAHTPVVAPF